MVATSRKYIIWKGRRNSEGIALTFDDGPHPAYTPAILDILRYYEISATFFLAGSEIAEYPELANRIIQFGHNIGNHTYSHSILRNMDKASLEYEINKTEEVINEYTGRTTSLFRPPKGVISLPMLRICMKQELKVIMWSVDSIDYSAEDSQSVIRNVDPDRVSNGDIILFHDKNIHTQKALPILIEEFRKKGLTFSTVKQML